MRKRNDRLGAALAYAKSSVKRRKYAFEDPEIQRKARAIWLATKEPSRPTTNMRVHSDVVTLCKQAWPKGSDRIVGTSDVLREAAKKKLGI